MTPELMHRISRALQRGRPTLQERDAITAAAQQAPIGATTLQGEGAQLLAELERRARDGKPE